MSSEERARELALREQIMAILLGNVGSFSMYEQFAAPKADAIMPLLLHFALAERRDLAREFRLNDTHYHNTFEPDNCNCMFCRALAALEAQIGKGEPR